MIRIHSHALKIITMTHMMDKSKRSEHLSLSLPESDSCYDLRSKLMGKLYGQNPYFDSCKPDPRGHKIADPDQGAK